MGLHQPPDTKETTIAAVFEDALMHWSLPMDSLRGQTYDGAANMAGEYNGCQAIMSPRQPLATKLWLRPPTNHNATLDH